MNIQPSVIIWTVICFSLLMLILRNLLFKPVLKVLDQRRLALEAAREKKAEYALREKELSKSLEEAQAKNTEKRKEAIKAAVAEIQADEKAQAKLAQRKCLEELDAYRKDRVKEYEKVIQTAGPQMKEVADILAQKITSYKA